MQSTRFSVCLILSLFSTIAWGDFVSPPAGGSFAGIDQIQGYSNQNFCIFRQVDDGSQKPIFCLDGKSKRIDLRGSANVGSLFVGEKIVISDLGLYDSLGRMLIDFKSGQWVGNGSGLVGPKGDRGEPGLVGAKGDKGDQGVPGLKGSFKSCQDKHVSETYQNISNQIGFEISCPKNTFLVGGGCSIESIPDSGEYLLASEPSYPMYSNNRWRCAFRKSRSGLSTYKAHAICCAT